MGSTAVIQHYRSLENRWAPQWGITTIRLMLLTITLTVAGLLCQFATSIFEFLPFLGLLACTLTALCDFVLILILLARWPLTREPAIAIILAGPILALAWTGVDAKLRHIRGYDGHPGYQLPHRDTAEHTANWQDPLPQTVVLTTSDGVTLKASWWSNGKRRGIIYYPGWHTNRQAFAIQTMASWLSKEWSVLVLDPRGQGESAGVKSPSGSDSEDILAAGRFLRSNGCQRIGVLTEQDGTMPVLLAAAKHEGIHSLALAAPTTAWGQGLMLDGTHWNPLTTSGRLYWRARAGLKLSGASPEPIDPITILQQVAPTPILFCGSREATEQSLIRYYHAAGEPKSAVVLGQSGIPCMWDEMANYHKTVKDWFQLTLRR